MKLFEGGILDKITNDEYERMFQSYQLLQNAQHELSDMYEEKQGTESNKKDEEENPSTIDGKEYLKTKVINEKELTALSLRMLQGAFYLAIIGYMMAMLVFIFEIGHVKFSDILTSIKRRIRNRLRPFLNKVRQLRLRLTNYY